MGVRPDRLAIALAGLVALAFALVGLDARATTLARTTADEPQYLLTAQSLAEDGSLDISDEIAGRAYLPYHEITIDRQTRVLDDGREVSPHDPLLPALLALPMAVGGWVGAKLALAVLAGLTAAATAFVAIRRFGSDPVSAGVVVAASFAGIPLAAYGTQVYPELPAALAVLIAFAAITTPSPRLAARLSAGVAIVALPWLAVKYVPIAAVLGVGLLVTLGSRRSRLVASGGFAVAGLVYLLAHRRWYGGWTVYSAGDHFERTGEFSVVGTDVDLLGRSRRLVGLLVDREFGIAAWSPVWLLLPFVALLIVRHRPRWWGLWLAVVATGWLNATYVALTMHGWWVPGRQLVVVLPLAAAGVAWLVAHRPALRAPTIVLGAIGAVNWLWLAAEASTGRRTLVVDFMDTAAVPYRLWSPLLPSGLAATGRDDLVLALWAVATVVAGVVVWRRALSARSTR